MLRKSLAILVSTAFALSLSAASNTPPSAPKLSAAEIVDKNVAARGGPQAWRAVQSMIMEGKMGVGGNQRATLPTPMPGKKGRPNHYSAATSRRNAVAVCYGTRSASQDAPGTSVQWPDRRSGL